MNIYDKKNMIINFFWKLGERFLTQGISILVTVILARILSPKEYGIVAICMISINFFNIFIDGGLGQALIQKKQSDSVDFNTVFFFNAVFCCVVYLILYFLSGSIENIFQVSGVSNVIKILGIVLIISAIRNVHQVYAVKKMLYKKIFSAALSAVIISGCISIYMAYSNYGIWSLVGQQLSYGLVFSVVMWFIIPWHPHLEISFRRLKGLYSYSWKLLASSLIDTIYRQSWQLVVGKKYSISDLAYYNQGEKFPALIINNINNAIDGILFPALSNYQNNIDVVREYTRRAMKTSICIIAPVQMLLAFSADSVVTIILAEQWLPCVPFFRIFCITYMFTPLHTANLNAIKALGRSDIFLKLEIIRKSIAVCILFLAMPYGREYLLVGLLIGEVCGQFVNSYPNKKLLQYSYLQQLLDILPSVIIASLAGFISYSVNFLCISIYYKLILQYVLGIVVYIFISYVFKIESFIYIAKKCIGLYK